MFPGLARRNSCVSADRNDPPFHDLAKFHAGDVSPSLTAITVIHNHDFLFVIFLKKKDEGGLYFLSNLTTQGRISLLARGESKRK